LRRRQCQRYKKRLETTFSSGNLSFRGISSNLSAGGLFVRTQHGFVPGTIVDIEIFLPNEKVARLKGIVRRAVKTTLPGVKNGMGIELIERDTNYLEFIKTIVNEQETSSEKSETPCNENKRSPEDQVIQDEDKETRQPEYPEFILITCENCKVKNRVPSNKVGHGLRCGKCGVPLNIMDRG